MTTRTFLADACESLDAGIFSGDVLYQDEERAALKEYVERWQRAIVAHEQPVAWETGPLAAD